MSWAVLTRNSGMWLTCYTVEYLTSLDKLAFGDFLNKSSNQMNNVGRFHRISLYLQPVHIKEALHARTHLTIACLEG